MDNIAEDRECVASVMRRLYDVKLTTTLGGNLSMRLPDNTILITPSGTDKSQIISEDIGRMTFDGEVIGENFVPSIESSMHLEIYAKREDVKFVIHAHPPYLSAFSATTAKINSKLTVETYALLGSVSYAAFASMGTRQLALNVAKASIGSNCILMRNHGALTVGRTVTEAFDRMEVFENAARMTILTGLNLSDYFNPLTKEQCEEIDQMVAGMQVKSEYS